MAEAPGWDFEQFRQGSREAWNRELGRIHVETMNESTKECSIPLCIMPF